MILFFTWEREKWERYGLATVLVVISFCFFRVLQYAADWYLFGKRSFPSFLNLSSGDGRAKEIESISDFSTLTSSAISRNKKWRISNEVVSLLHAAMSGFWALSACIIYPEMFSDMVGWYNLSTSYLILMSTGYMLHDLLDLLMNERSMRIMELLFHHVVVLTAFYATLSTGHFLGVVVCGLLMEVNSIFLHSRSLLNLYGCAQVTSVYRIASVANIVTLVVFRMVVSGYLLVWEVMSWRNLGWYQMILIPGLAVSNSVLAYRVLSADGYLGQSRVHFIPPSPSIREFNSGGKLVLVGVDVEE